MTMHARIDGPFPDSGRHRFACGSRARPWSSLALNTMALRAPLPRPLPAVVGDLPTLAPVPMPKATSRPPVRCCLVAQR